jgi:hypothetical protein
MPHALLPPAPVPSCGAAATHPVAPQTEEDFRQERMQGIVELREAVDALCTCPTDIAEHSLQAKSSEEENARAASKQVKWLLAVCAKQHGAAF